MEMLGQFSQMMGMSGPKSTTKYRTPQTPAQRDLQRKDQVKRPVTVKKTVTPDTIKEVKKIETPIPVKKTVTPDMVKKTEKKKKKKKKKGFKPIQAIAMPKGMGQIMQAIQTPMQQIEAMMDAEDQIDTEEYEALQQQHSLSF